MSLGDRTKYIGGSDVGIIRNNSKFMKRNDLLLIKAGLKENDFIGNRYTRFGSEIENTIILDTEFEIDIKISDRQAVFEKPSAVDTISYKCHVDGLIHESTGTYIYEAKTVGKQFELLTDDVDSVIKHFPSYYDQVQYNMYLADSEIALLDFAHRKEDDNSFFIGSHKRYWIERDDVYIRDMFTDINEFLIELMELKNNPELAERYRDDAGIDSDTVNELIQVETEIAKLKERQKQLKEQVFNEMQMSNKSKYKNDFITISLTKESVREGRIDTKKMIADGIDIEKYRGKETIVKPNLRIKLAE